MPQRLLARGTELDQRTRRVLTASVVAVGCGVLFTAGLVLIGGWGAGVDALKSVGPGFSTMKANAAIAIGALGVALALTGAGKPYRRIGNASASVALAIGLLTLAEYAFHWDAGIDQLWFEDIATPSAASPGRPAAATALMVTLLGASVLCVGRPALAWARTAAAVITSLIAWATLNGYLFGPQALREVWPFSSIAIHTAALMFLLSVGALAAEPVSWPIRTALTRDTGGVIFRWLLPPAVLAPPILGWFLSRSGAMDLFPAQFDWALFSAISTAGSVWLIVTLVHRITVIDAERTEASELSRHDPLTGLANRRAFDAFLLQSFNLSRRHGHALSLLMFDIDRFKSYNDAFGHPAGDELLKDVSVFLSSVARQTDLVARLGGEEFGVVLPETDAAGAWVLGERARAELEQSTNGGQRVTVSVGVSTLSPTMRAPADLVQDCDSALYRAKSGGRNRVCSNSAFLPRAAGA